MDDDDELILGDSTDKHGLSKWTEALISRKIAIPENACIGEWVDACPEIPSHLLSHGARGAVRLVQRRRKMQATMGATGAHGVQYFSAIEALWLSDYGQLWLRKTPATTATDIKNEAKPSTTRNGIKRTAVDRGQTGERMDKRAKMQDANSDGMQTWGAEDEDILDGNDLDEYEEDGIEEEEDVDVNEEMNEDESLQRRGNRDTVVDENEKEEDEVEEMVELLGEDADINFAYTEVISSLMKSDKSGHNIVLETSDGKTERNLPLQETNDVEPFLSLPQSASAASFEDNTAIADDVDLSLYYSFEDAYMFLASNVPSFDEFLVYSHLRASSFAVVIHKGSSYLDNDSMDKDELVPSFDVYARDGITSFRPSAPGPPDFFVIVAKSSDALPGPFSYDRSIDRLQEYNAGLRSTQAMWTSMRKKVDTNAVPIETSENEKSTISTASTVLSSKATSRYPKPVIRCAIVSHSVVTFFALAGVELATPSSGGGRGRGRGRGRGGRGGRSRGGRGRI